MNASDQANVTLLLDAVRAGDSEAVNKLFPLVYKELHAQAKQQRQRWHGNRTLNTTALVHEAYIKLVDPSQASWQSRAHFLGVAAKAMRHILIDYAKRSRRKKRGGDVAKASFDDLEEHLVVPEDLPNLADRADTLLELDSALERLAALNERQCRVVECRFFGGMTIPDTAAALGISPSTVKRDWILAQAWLYREIASM